MRLLVATITSLLLAALAASAAGAAGAAPARGAKLTAAEQKWATPAVQVWNVMNNGLKQVTPQVTANQALLPGTAANKALITTLGNFVTCSSAMKKLGPPPTARLKPFAASMASGCVLLANGAHGIANGISSIYKLSDGKLGAAQVKAALKTLGRGSAKLAIAARQLQTVGKN